MARTGTGRRSTPVPHSFSQTPDSKHPRSSFDRSHSMKCTLDSGLLVPVLVEEILPGDTVSLIMYNFARLATITRPVMDNLRLTCFFFFTANRILWDNWTAFMGSRIDPDDDPTIYTVPQITQGGSGWAEGSMADYFGIPINIPGVAVNALPFRAANLIWNEWFRDQNLQDSVANLRGDGPDGGSNYVMMRRGKAHDYITSCLPFLQKGPAVEVPLGTTAPVIATGDATPTFAVGGSTSTIGMLADGFTAGWTPSGTTDTTAQWSQTKLVANLAGASAATINALRLSNALQILYERDARGGTRYPELMHSQFGVTLPDQQWRPEYLGGGSQPITVTPTPQTSRNDTSGNGHYLGDLGAYGTSAGAHGFTKSFVEHGWLMGFVSVNADIFYQQALDRKWTRLTREDHYIPALANLGEQSVLNREVYLQDPATSGTDNTDTWGYQERWAEYKYASNSIRGKFRSTATSNLEMYHYGLEFASLPVLGDAFIQDTPPLDRIVAVNTQPEILLDAFFRINHTRVMPTYSVPSLMSRF